MLVRAHYRVLSMAFEGTLLRVKHGCCRHIIAAEGTQQRFVKHGCCRHTIAAEGTLLRVKYGC